VRVFDEKARSTLSILGMKIRGLVLGVERSRELFF
jgi:hypothetical protein